jgi:molybdenum cofactor cytidylyltransferase
MAFRYALQAASTLLSAPVTTAALLLAAGMSRRFGAADKLLAPLGGRPLVTHAADALRATGLAPLIAVTASEDVAVLLDGFILVRLDPGPAAQSRSLAAGIAAAESEGADRVLVALGDMPRITADLVRDVVSRCPEGGAAAAFDGARPMPPACFDRDLFAELRAMTGDRGAAPILRGLPPEALVPASPDVLLDIDRPEDLAGLASGRTDRDPGCN